MKRNPQSPVRWTLGVRGLLSILILLLTVSFLMKGIIFFTLKESPPKAWDLIKVGVAFDFVASSAITLVSVFLALVFRRFPKLLPWVILTPVWGMILMLLGDLGFYFYSGIHFDQGYWAYLSPKNLYFIRGIIWEQLQRPPILLAVLALVALGVLHLKWFWNLGLKPHSPQSITSHQSDHRRILLFAATLLTISLALNVFVNRWQKKIIRHHSGVERNVLIVNLNQLFETGIIQDPSPQEIQEFWNAAFIGKSRAPSDPEFPFIRSPIAQVRLLERLRKNIILIPLESFGGLAFTSLSPAVKDTTPQLAKISHEEGTLFTRAFMNSNPTAPALASTLCSVYDIKGVARNHPYHRFRCGPEILSSEGFRTAFIAGTAIDFDNRRNFYSHNGFDQMWGEEKFSFQPEMIIRGQFGKYNDEEVFRESLRWIDEHQKNRESEPYFLTIMTASSHDPFPDHGSEFYSRDGLGKMNRLYSSMKYVDAQVAKFIQELKKRPHYSDTIVVVFGDHPPWFEYEIGESGGDWDVGDPFLHSWIPLLVLNADRVAPDRFPRGKRIDTIVSQVDLFPTLLDLVGISGTNAFVGHSLLDSSISDRERFAFVQVNHFGQRLLIQSNEALSWPISGERKKEESELYSMDDFPRETLLLEDEGLRQAMTARGRVIERLTKWGIESNRFWSEVNKRNQ